MESSAVLMLWPTVAWNVNSVDKMAWQGIAPGACAAKLSSSPCWGRCCACAVSAIILTMLCMRQGVNNNGGDWRGSSEGRSYDSRGGYRYNDR